MNHAQVRALLDDRYQHYDQPAFIQADPISIPHRFSQRQDVEISGLFAALLAWGRRPTIISKCLELMRRMDDAPYQFITQHQDEDLKGLLGFCHRTFCDTDLLYFVHWLRWFYGQHDTLEDAFLIGSTQKERLENFHNLFFSLDDAPQRTRKHVATPARGSACKRVNMYLRWMVRPDNRGVDFGLWTRLSPADLICPCDVHVERVARRLGLLDRKQMDWLAAEDLTAHLRSFDPTDPVKYDFALFGLGVEGEM
ncbi:TIGR02757 family protein [Hymenobacter taeanensis]|uniref:TIGR02757 family protein n=1 Tax=Hymenobacter taeanensis TaxID=2735321 RepID=A0A6M6BJZ9_9BACT|nr:MULTISPECIES: TIGR02757 family protein [Hymenobacter]QJX48911.1 TIGR02757 family protein [Hymenobacter taeanensis]UOQ81574.1 TIGR02757 family protein [Hymenobacter sp. 5414T-23]